MNQKQIDEIYNRTVNISKIMDYVYELKNATKFLGLDNIHSKLEKVDVGVETELAYIQVILEECKNE